jgi:hypothetical protein
VILHRIYPPWRLITLGRWEPVVIISRQQVKCELRRCVEEVIDAGRVEFPLIGPPPNFQSISGFRLSGSWTSTSLSLYVRVLFLWELISSTSRIVHASQVIIDLLRDLVL